MTKRIINCETGEVIERELTDEEIAEQLEDELRIEKENKKAEKELEVKEAARQAILDRLGLTEEEARLLLG